MPQIQRCFPSKEWAQNNIVDWTQDLASIQASSGQPWTSETAMLLLGALSCMSNQEPQPIESLPATGHFQEGRRPQ